MYIAILCEGQTEKNFVANILTPTLFDLEIFFQPIILTTSRENCGKKITGGFVNYAKVKKELLNLLFKPNFDLVTTFFDYYKLPTSFPGFEIKSHSLTIYQKVEHLENCFRSDIAQDKFLPFIMIHEFEALLYTSPSITSRMLGIQEIDFQQNISTTNPEEINDTYDTSPSHRIFKVKPDYKKTIDSYQILKEIGLKALREKCRHFNDWLTKIENYR